MAEKMNITNNRERYMERLKAKYPDKDYADDEALFGQINDDYDDYDNKMSEYQGREQELSDFFARDPRSAAFLTDWKKGEDPLAIMIRRYGDDFKQALEDPKKRDDLIDANKDYAERIAKEQDYEKEFEQNALETAEVIENVMTEDGLSDEDINSAIKFLVGIAQDWVMGKVSAESIRMAIKAINHDADVSLADREGEVRGRNTKIEEKLRKTKGDTIPDLSGKNSAVQAPRKASSIFDLAKEAN